MKQQTVTFTLSLPDDAPDLEAIIRTARQLRYTPDEWFSRCILAHTMQVQMMEANDSPASGDLPDDCFGTLTDDAHEDQH